MYGIYWGIICIQSRAWAPKVNWWVNFHSECACVTRTCIGKQNLTGTPEAPFLPTHCLSAPKVTVILTSDTRGWVCLFWTSDPWNDPGGTPVCLASSADVVFVRFGHAAVVVLIAVYSSVISSHHHLLLHPTVNGHLGCLQFGAVMNIATLSILLKTFICFKETVSLSQPFPAVMWLSARCFLVGVIKLWCYKAPKSFLREEVILLKRNLLSPLLPPPAPPLSRPRRVGCLRAYPWNQTDSSSNPGPALS